jgi:hypothetical protein
VPNLALIALGDSHHSQGGMKFATQISPLLNCYDLKIEGVFMHSRFNFGNFSIKFLVVLFLKFISNFENRNEDGGRKIL